MSDYPPFAGLRASGFRHGGRAAGRRGADCRCGRLRRGRSTFLLTLRPDTEGGACGQDFRSGLAQQYLAFVKQARTPADRAGGGLPRHGGLGSAFLKSRPAAARPPERKKALGENLAAPSGVPARKRAGGDAQGRGAAEAREQLGRDSGFARGSRKNVTRVRRVRGRRPSWT